MEILTDFIQEVLKYIANPELISPTFFSFWQVLRIIFLAITVFFIGLLAYLFRVNGYLDMRFIEDHMEFRKTKPHLKVKIDKDWDEIVKQSKSEKEAERKLAVIEADDTLDDVLSQVEYKGETLMEKLEGLNEDVIPHIEEIKDAHRKRRDINYDPNTSLSKKEAEEIVSLYGEVLKDMQIF